MLGIYHFFIRRVKFRSRLRALLALSALAPSSLAEEVMAGEKEKQGWCALGDGLNSLTDLRRYVSLAALLRRVMGDGCCVR